ncbi:MAG: prevent-host-death protein [Chloroflexi bacterium RIFOXYC12_FULL_59_14]|nr:MAG: prevent-host-death protein [Chloroflexi bacterium RIFOXYD12_FULL_57_15]OGO76120.1 MAG: prevent-host-death protein [Chloroflexi bacterium RIFOXYC12_FULL_59_14]
MSNLYTYSSARQKLASILEQALREGEVRVRRRDGRVFVIKPEVKSDSPFAVKSVDLGITTEEIVQFVRESRPVYK